MKQRHFFADKTPEQILLDQAEILRAHAVRMPVGMKRDRLLGQAADLELQVNVQTWIVSPGLPPPER